MRGHGTRAGCTAACAAVHRSARVRHLPAATLLYQLVERYHPAQRGARGGGPAAAFVARFIYSFKVVDASLVTAAMYHCDRPIFVFGCPRSGTSLLSRMLNKHPRIGIPFESHFYLKFQPRIETYGDLNVDANRRALVQDMLQTLHDWTPPPSLERALEGMRVPSLHGAVDSIINDWCVQNGKPRWGEKTPSHAFYWRELAAAFPGAMFVHLIRDGRDVSVSWKRAPFGPKHVYIAAQRWRDFQHRMHAAKRELPASRFYELRYEDLIQSPESVIRQLCAYLDEDYSPEMLAFYTDSTPYPTDERNLENLTRPLMQDNIYKWRTNMPPKDVALVEAVAKHELQAAGYEVTNPDAEIGRIERFYYARVLHPMLRVRSMARNRQGQTRALKDLSAFAKRRARLLRSRVTGAIDERVAKWASEIDSRYRARFRYRGASLAPNATSSTSSSSAITCQEPEAVARDDPRANLGQQ